MLTISLNKLSFLSLCLTIPLFPSTPYAGVPLWAWISLGMSALYALILIVHIEKEWESEEEDG